MNQFKRKPILNIKFDSSILKFMLTLVDKIIIPIVPKTRHAKTNYGHSENSWCDHKNKACVSNGNISLYTYMFCL